MILLRKVLTDTPSKRAEALRSEIEHHVATLLDAMERKGPPVDLIADLGVKVPALTMCNFFGTPYEDHDLIMRCAAGRHGLHLTPKESLEKAQELFEQHRWVEF